MKLKIGSPKTQVAVEVKTIYHKIKPQDRNKQARQCGSKGARGGQAEKTAPVS